MLKVYKKLKKRYKLIALYFLRIIFVKNKFRVSLIKKIKANLSGGFLADQWILYDFDKNDKKDYLSEFDWYRSRYINEPFDFMLNNKIVATEVLNQYVKVADNFAIKNRGVLTDFNSKYVEYNDVIRLIEEKRTVFLKPFGTGKGKGVYRLSYSNNEYFIDDKSASLEEILNLLTSMDNWFVSEALVQTKYADDIYNKTTNTIRMITLRDIETKQIKIFFAVQRIGTQETIPVDNGSRGGLVSKINLETGCLSEARSLHSLDVHTIHPNSKAPIKGVVIPNWDKVKEEILDLANKFPYMHFIAWDILLTEEGLSIVEANTSSGVNIIQLWGGQRNGELGRFYKHHKVIK